MWSNGFNQADWIVFFDGQPVMMGSTTGAVFSLGGPLESEPEPHLGFIRESYYENGRFKVRRVPIVHG